MAERVKTIEEIHQILFEEDNSGSEIEDLCELDSDDTDEDPDYIPEDEDEIPPKDDPTITPTIDDFCMQEPVTKKKKVQPSTRTKKTSSALGNKHPILDLKELNYYGKDGYTWSKNPLKNTSGKKISKKNIVYIRPGTVGAASQLSKPIDIFSLFFSENIIDTIIARTNEEIHRQKLNYRNQGNSTLCDLSKEEFYGLLGILILAGALQINHLSTNFIFNTELCGKKFIATMPKCRFNFLINCLRFDNKETRLERTLESKLAPVSEIWGLLIENCQKHYRPSSYLTIDEQLVGFRGRCPFRLYIPSKPEKYGIKIIMMCDNSTKYVLNAIPYAGKGTVPENIPAAAYFVEELVKCVRGSHRNITTDNWFTSLPLMKNLVSNFGLTMIGTIRKNKKELPPEFLDIKYENRKAGSSMFLFADEVTAVSYKSKDNKLVSLVSSMHEEASIDSSSEKPEMIKTYNQTKGAVDTFDQMCHNTNCGRKTKRWPLCFFYNMINIGVINAYVIYLSNFVKNNPPTSKALSRQMFFIQLHDELTSGWKLRRLQSPTLKLGTRGIIEETLGSDVPPSTSTPTNSEFKEGPRKYCYLCNYTKKRMSKIYCATCKKPICREHQKKVICSKC